MHMYSNSCPLTLGALIRRTSGGQTVFQRTDIGTSSNNYQGYAVASGRFLTTNRQGTKLAKNETLQILIDEDFLHKKKNRFCSLCTTTEHVLWSC